MKKNSFYLLFILFFLQTQISAQSFDVNGNTSVDDPIPHTMEEETVWPYNGINGGDNVEAVEVTFDSGLPLKVTGLSPSNMVLTILKPNGTEHSMLFTGSMETYDDAHPENFCNDQWISWESPASPYNKMWWESKNAARILVRMRTAMVWEDYQFPCGSNNPADTAPIAREDRSDYPNPTVTPWGAEGEWSDEYYWIYPDGTHTRYVKMYTQNAENTSAFGGDRSWLNGNTVHDAGDLQIWFPESQGLTGTLENGSGITLMKMDGSSNSYSIYQPFVENGNGPGYDNLSIMDGGQFQASNIAIVNLVGTDYNPFIVGEAPTGGDYRYSFNEDADYENEGNDEDDTNLPNYFHYDFPEEAGSMTMNMGFLINQSGHERIAYDPENPAPAYISFVWLRGIVPVGTDEVDALKLAKSWEAAPDMTINSDGFSGGNFEKTERAYHVVKYGSNTSLTVTVEASSQSPFVRGAMVVENWGSNLATEISRDGTLLIAGTDYQQGLEGNNLVIWLNVESEDATQFTICQQSVGCGENDNPEICNNGIDDDGDGLIDNNDPDCFMSEICNDGLDNDGDGLIDCDDLDCDGCADNCPVAEICDNGIDDDCDGLIDDMDCDCMTSCQWYVLAENDFEESWGIWKDGGSDCRRSIRDASYANSGDYCIRLRDNTNSSVMETEPYDLTDFSELKVEFSYYCRSMDNSNEDFWLQISTDGGDTFVTIEEWNKGDEFENNERYNDEVVISGVVFSEQTSLRFRCDASSNADWVYIDDIVISGCGVNSINTMFSDKSRSYETQVSNRNLRYESNSQALDKQISEKPSLIVYPNPLSSNQLLYLELSGFGDHVEITIFDMMGKLTEVIRTSNNHGDRINIPSGKLENGIYFLRVTDNDIIQTIRLIIQKQ